MTGSVEISSMDDSNGPNMRMARTAWSLMMKERAVGIWTRLAGRYRREMVGDERRGVN